jgi:hypothetical protein
METTKMKYFEKIESVKQRDFLNAHNNCTLCGTTLELQHIRVESNSEIKEEAHCRQCELRTRAKIYALN